MKYKNPKTGQTLDIKEWEVELDKFWAVFNSSRLCGGFGSRLPHRPTDAWERFKKVMGLVAVGE